MKPLSFSFLLIMHVKNAPNNTGMAVCGDHMDFDNLYEALHTVVGDEYRKIKDDVNAAGKEYNCPVENIGTNVDYPEDFEW